MLKTVTYHAYDYDVTFMFMSGFPDLDEDPSLVRIAAALSENTIRVVFQLEHLSIYVRVRLMLCSTAHFSVDAECVDTMFPPPD